MKFAFYADTPYHILNCINFVWNNIEDSKNSSDLFIHKQFSGYNDLLPALKKAKLFNNIYECNIPIKRDENKLEHLIYRFIELFFPNYYLKKWIGKKNINLQNKYRIIMMPAPLRFTIALFDLNRDAKVWFYEDGTVNYYGNILDAYGPKYKTIIKNLFNKGHETIVPCRVYLNNAERGFNCEKWKNIQLPKLNFSDDAFSNLIKATFGEIFVDKRYNIIYLSMPFEEIDADKLVDVKEVFCSTLKPLLKYKDKVVIKPHPREKVNDYCGLEVLHDTTQWEIYCASHITEEMILIGNFSTAQFTPKFLFDKEPFLIFTYRMYKRVNNLKQDLEEKMISDLQKTYVNPNKIFVVQNLTEYINAIETALKMT